MLQHRHPTDFSSQRLVPQILNCISGDPISPFSPDFSAQRYACIVPRFVGGGRQASTFGHSLPEPWNPPCQQSHTTDSQLLAPRPWQRPTVACGKAPVRGSELPFGECCSHATQEGKKLQIPKPAGR